VGKQVDERVTFEVVHVPQRLSAGNGWISVRCKCGAFLMEVNDEEGLREAQEGWVEHMEQVWEMLKEKPINGSIGQ
jgi:hypothetical protein